MVFQRSLPSSTSMPASSAVIALVSEPMWNLSLTVTGVSVPSRLVPTAPAATILPFFTTAAATAGNSKRRR